MNCLYNGPAKQMNDTKGKQIMAELCPELVGKKTCCSTKQLQALQDNVNTLHQLSGRCPACWNNMRKLYCETTCSPDQSLFMDPVAVFGTVIQEVAVFLSPQFKQSLYDSCKDVIFPGNNEKIMNLLCGTTADKCTPQKLLHYLGSTTNGFAPFTIDYPQNLTVPNVQWMKGTPYKCNETFIDPATNATASPCSCQDCHASCPAPAPASVVPVPGKILGMDKLTFAMALSYILFLVIFFSASIFCIMKRPKMYALVPDEPQTRMKYTTSSTSVTVSNQTSAAEPGLCEKLGGALEGKLRKVFTWWGVWCSHHPFVVMGASVVVIAIFACGLFFFHVTTDPVELWSSPTSEARREKDIFDTKFSPFYRTEQIIVKSAHPNNTGYKPYGDAPFVPFGPVFHKDLLNKVLLSNSLLQSRAKWLRRSSKISYNLGYIPRFQ